MAQMMHKPVVDQPGPGCVKLLREAGKPLALSHHDAEHPLAVVRHLELGDSLRRDGQGRADRQGRINRRLGRFGLAQAFGPRDLKEHELLVREIGVDRRL